MWVVEYGVEVVVGTVDDYCRQVGGGIGVDGYLGVPFRELEIDAGDGVDICGVDVSSVDTCCVGVGCVGVGGVSVSGVGGLAQSETDGVENNGLDGIADDLSFAFFNAGVVGDGLGRLAEDEAEERTGGGIAASQ